MSTAAETSLPHWAGEAIPGTGLELSGSGLFQRPRVFCSERNRGTECIERSELVSFPPSIQRAGFGPGQEQKKKESMQMFKQKLINKAKQ